MPKVECWFKQDLKKPVKVQTLNGNVFTLDNVGSLIGVEVYDNGSPATLSGSANGYIILPDDTTVSVAGTRSGNKVSINLPQSALAIPGFIKIAVKLTNSSEITTLLAVVATVYKSRTDTIITPSQQIITDWSQQIAAEMQAVEDASAAQDAKIDDLKSAIQFNDLNVHNTGNEISTIDGWWVGDYGALTKSTARGYLVVPVANIYIDGVATLKSGTLGYYQETVFSFAYLDKNLHIISAEYSNITSPHTFSIEDIPSGTVYVAFNSYSTATPRVMATFAFKSTDTTIEENRGEISEINARLENAGRYEIPLYFASTTGYYNKDKGYTEYAASRAAEVQTSAGNIYFLNSRCYFGMAQVAFLGSNDAVVSVIYAGGGTSAVENMRFIAPENAVKMLVQMVGDYTVTLWQTDIKTKLDTAISDIAEIENATTEPTGEEIELTFESATGYYTSIKSFSEYSGVTVAKVDVTEGQQYLLTTRNYFNAAIACMLDSQNTVVAVAYVANNTQGVLDYPITIAPGVSKLMIQRFYGYSPTKLEIVTGVKAKSVCSILNGKRITLIGDSITEKNSRARMNWALWIDDWAHPVIQNLGASGTGFIAGGANPYSNRIQSINNPDIIGIACSFNDMNNSIEDLTNAAETFFDTIIAAYPSVPIICYVQSPWSAYHYGIATSDLWVNTLKDICQKKGIPFYDEMYNGSALKPWIAENRAVYYINDGEGSTGEEDWVHPNSDGHKVIARHLYPHFAENLVATGLDYFVP